MNEDRKTHPSYGLISWGRVSGQQTLFMSPLEHHNYIEVTISEAATYRSINETRVLGQKHIIRVAMTEAQFAQFITTPDRMPGVPCTIGRRDGQRVPDCPRDEQQLEFKRELKKDAKKVLTGVNELDAKVEEMLHGKTVKKADLKKVRAIVQDLVRDAHSNMPYLLEQFHEYMDGVYHDAVALFEGHVQGRLRELGIKEVVEQQGCLRKLLGEPEDG